MLPTIGTGVGVWAGAGVWARASAIAPIAITTSPRKRTRRSVSMASPPRMLPYALEARRSYVGGPRRWGNRPGSGAPRRRATGAAPARGADRRSAGPIPGNARPSRRDHRALAPGLRTIGTPADFETVYDLVNFYFDFLETLPQGKVTLIGFSFGGWLAAELAVKCRHRLEGLVLVDAVGIKVSDRETPDILEVFNTSPQEVQRRSWHDPETWAPDLDALSDDELVVRARNWESLCLYGWNPYMYN